MVTWITEGYPGGSVVKGKSAPLAFKRAPEKGVLHTTEGTGFPNYPKGFEPHATAHPAARQWQQHTPLDHAAYALKAPGTLSTNTLGAIQVEIVGYASSVKDLAGDDLAYLLGFLDFFFGAAGIPKQSSVTFVGGEGYGLNAAQRLSRDQWDQYKGWLGHQHVPGNSHWDPGAVPIGSWLVTGVTNPLPPVTPPPPPPPPPAKPNCQALQSSVHTLADNLWGSDTDDHCNALREASAWGGHDFPYGVPFAQLVVGTKQDGKWGPNSKAAHDFTVENVQQALLSMGFNPGAIDGIWGNQTEAAYQAARNACHV